MLMLACQAGAVLTRRTTISDLQAVPSLQCHMQKAGTTLGKRYSCGTSTYSRSESHQTQRECVRLFHKALQVPGQLDTQQVWDGLNAAPLQDAVRAPWTRSSRLCERSGCAPSAKAKKGTNQIAGFWGLFVILPFKCLYAAASVESDRLHLSRNQKFPVFKNLDNHFECLISELLQDAMQHFQNRQVLERLDAKKDCQV